MKDFDMMAKLGEGSFGQVYRVRRKADGKEYAMKKVFPSPLRSRLCL